jgi:hypothetical protein
MKLFIRLLTAGALVLLNIFVLQNIHLATLDMQLLDRLIEIIRFLVWPLTMVFTIKLFEQEIRNFIARLKSFSGPGGVGAEAYEGQQKVEENRKIEELVSELEKKKDLEKTLIEALNETDRNIKEYELLLHFEKTYRLIFGSQLGILLRLRDQLIEGVDAATIVLMYRASGWYEKGYQIGNYLGFLTNSGLTELNNGNNKYKITALGIVFLGYLEKENIPLNKPF